VGQAECLWCCARRIGGRVGAGANGTVYEARLHVEGRVEEVVAKTLNRPEEELTARGFARVAGLEAAGARFRSQLLLEYEMMASLPAGLAPRAVGIFRVETERCPASVLVMERCHRDMFSLCGLGWCDEAVRAAARRELSERTVGFLPGLLFDVVARELCALVSALHADGVFLRDLKLENLGLAQEGGSARFLLQVLDCDPNGFYVPAPAPAGAREGEGGREEEGGAGGLEGVPPGSREWWRAHAARSLAADPSEGERGHTVPRAFMEHRTLQMRSLGEGEWVVDPVGCNSFALALTLIAACRESLPLSPDGFADRNAVGRAWLVRQFANVSNAVARRLQAAGMPFDGPPDTWRAQPLQVRQALVEDELRFQRTGIDPPFLSISERQRDGSVKQVPAFDFFRLVGGPPLQRETRASNQNPLHRPYVQRALLLLMLPLREGARMSPTVALHNLTLFRADHALVVARAAGPRAPHEAEPPALDATLLLESARALLLQRMHWLDERLSREDEAAWMDQAIRRKRGQWAAETLDRLHRLREDARAHADIERILPFFSIARSVLDVHWPRAPAGDADDPWARVPDARNAFGDRPHDIWFADHFP
jgi:hypothetical protein